MSYVICSNVENEDTIIVGGHSDPATFLNSFKSPLIIEPDSEVAVESVKIERADEWDIKDSDQFFFYFGPKQTASVTSGDVPKNGVRINMRRGSYSLKGMRKELERAINESPIGPALFGNCTVESQTDASGKFNGFKFNFVPRSNASNRSGSLTEDMLEDNNITTIAYNASAVANSRETSYVYTPAHKTIRCRKTVEGAKFVGSNRRKVRSDASVRIKDYPLSNASGRLVYSLNASNQTSHPHQIGLVRPTNAYIRNGYPSTVSYPDETEGGTGGKASSYMDIYAVYDNESGGTLKLYTWGYDKGKDKWTQKEIKYYDAGGGITSVLTTADITNGTAEQLIFELIGDEMTVSINSSKSAEVPLVKQTISTVKRYNYAPLGNAQEALFPCVALTHNNQHVDILRYDAHVLPNWEHSVPSSYAKFGKTSSRAYQPRGLAYLIPGSDWYSNAVQSLNNSDELRYNQLRPSILWTTTASENFSYTGLNGSDVIDYYPVFVTGEEARDPGVNDFDQILYVIPIPRNMANMNRALGFGRFSVVEHPQFGGSSDTPGSRSLVSIEAGTYAVHSSFIRINDLPIQSFNGATSSRSNILYHLPKFSNDGRQFGELYFSVPEKTYIKLNNTDKIMLNQLKIDIVSRNERLVKDLSGATIICLHFRKSK